MKKLNRTDMKKPLALNAEVIRTLSDAELDGAAGGNSGTYCAGCGTGTACPVMRPLPR